VRRHEHEQRRTDPAPASPREPEPLPAEATVLGLQRSAGNRAVSTLLARQPSPSRQRASTSTLGLGDVIGVIPLESAQTGEADQDGNIHDLTVTFVGNAVVPKLNEMHAKGTPIDEGFYSSVAMKLTLKGIYITSMTVTDDQEGGGGIVTLTLNCASIVHEKAP
jgi:hypothetical protein